ncbi:MAG: hypothetical protein ACRCXC_06665, partial [Legionella sp.]
VCDGGIPELADVFLVFFSRKMLKTMLKSIIRVLTRAATSEVTFPAFTCSSKPALILSNSSLTDCLSKVAIDTNSHGLN